MTIETVPIGTLPELGVVPDSMFAWERRTQGTSPPWRAPSRQRELTQVPRCGSSHYTQRRPSLQHCALRPDLAAARRPDRHWWGISTGDGVGRKWAAPVPEPFLRYAQAREFLQSWSITVWKIRHRR